MKDLIVQENCHQLLQLSYWNVSKVGSLFSFLQLQWPTIHFICLRGQEQLGSLADDLLEDQWRSGCHQRKGQRLGMCQIGYPVPHTMDQHIRFDPYPSEFQWFHNFRAAQGEWWGWWGSKWTAEVSSGGLARERGGGKFTTKHNKSRFCYA